MQSNPRSHKTINHAMIALLATVSHVAIAMPVVAQSSAQSANPRQQRLIQRQLQRQCTTWFSPSAAIYSESTAAKSKQDLQTAQAKGDTRLVTRLAQSLGDQYLAAGRYTEATQSYQQAVTAANMTQQVANEIGSYSGIGNAYMGLGGYKKAETAYAKTIELTRSESGPLNYRFNQLGMALTMQGRFGEANATYQQGLASSPSTGSIKEFILANQGNVEFFTKSPAAAIAVYDRVLLANPSLKTSTNAQSVILMNNRGLAYQAIGQVEPATEAYNTALAALSRNNNVDCRWQTLSNYGRLLAEQGKLADATTYYRQATDLTTKIWHESRQTISPEDLQAFRQMIRPVHQELVMLLVAQGKFSEVAAVLEPLSSR
jgi:tetratricopeptide (TPR) repeat protein